MPIIEKRPARAFKTFQNHLSHLFNRTIQIPAPYRLEVTHSGTTGTLEFVRGDGIASAVPLRTEHGQLLYLTLTQFLEAVRELGKYRLTTKAYAYRLLNLPDPTSDAILRWEYVSDAPTDKWCRHHLQAAATVVIAGQAFDLNRKHPPSGWVTIEELIRFLIHDLGVKPVDDEWPSALQESERDFFEKFTGKRYRV